MFRVIIALVIMVNVYNVVASTTDCVKIVSSISSAKMMMIKNTNPKLKFLADNAIEDISKTKKIPVESIKRCVTVGAFTNLRGTY